MAGAHVAIEGSAWTADELRLLDNAIAKVVRPNTRRYWHAIADQVPGKNERDCLTQWNRCLDSAQAKGKKGSGKAPGAAQPSVESAENAAQVAKRRKKDAYVNSFKRKHHLRGGITMKQCLSEVHDSYKQSKMKLATLYAGRELAELQDKERDSDESDTPQDYYFSDADD